VGASRDSCFYQRDAGNRHGHTSRGTAQYRGDVEALANGAAIASVDIGTSTIRYCDNFNSLKTGEAVRVHIANYTRTLTGDL
jgi:hypothetical protein